MHKNMKTFVSKVNAATGRAQWLVQAEDYDFQQEIARSAYADMLHDTERNVLYEQGLKAAISEMRCRGQPCNVLDIGTGTGLLSMMAVRNGADTVTACDAFEPAAKCAEKIIAKNGMAGKIKLVCKRSTDMSVPEDMEVKANILVTEVFDTELIGEGAIGTFTHALKHLLQPDCIVIPSAARMYIQPVQSAYLRSCNELQIFTPHHLSPISIPGSTQRFTNDLGSPLFDLQLSELPRNLFNFLSPPKVVFRFDFCGRVDLPFEETTVTDFTMEEGSCCDAFLMWWDLDMDMKSDILLSCAPYWQHPNPRNQMQWRDHWMQAIFYPQRPLQVSKGETYSVISRHDEYSLSFNIADGTHATDCSNIERGTRMLHCVYTRSRLAMLQDETTINKFHQALTSLIDNSSHVLCISEGSFLPFLLGRMGVAKVLSVVSSFVGARKLTQSIIDHNSLAETISLYESYEDIPSDTLKQVSLVVGEPYFVISSLPWDDLYFWYVRSSLITDSGVKVVPQSARLMAMAVQFDNLHKIRAPLAVCEGLDMSIYDTFIEGARSNIDEYCEPQPLYEYPSISLSSPTSLLTFNFTKSVSGTAETSLNSSGQITIACDGSYNGMCLWIEYSLDDTTTVSHGLTEPVMPGGHPKWCLERKQAVHLPLNGTPVQAGKSTVLYKAAFNTVTGEMTLEFNSS